jgi:protein-disulfide isomerase
MQGSFEEMKKILFANYHDFATVSWGDLASRANLDDLDRFSRCMDDDETIARIQASKELASKMGVGGTPEVFVNGWHLPFTPSLEHFEKMIDNIENGLSPIEDVF